MCAVHPLVESQHKLLEISNPERIRNGPKTSVIQWLQDGRQVPASVFLQHVAATAFKVRRPFPTDLRQQRRR
jgi:hypothetical protein